MLKIIKKYTIPTSHARALRVALEKEGVRVLTEVWDGYKHVDLALPKAKINIEVDGTHHLTNPYQILIDLKRGYYSSKLGYDTIHIPNEMLHEHLDEISKALAEASKIRSREIKVHVG